MDSVRVKIKGNVVSSKYGALRAGDIVSTDAEYGRHLVDECGAGEYVDAAVDPAAPGADRTVETAPRAKKEQTRNG